MFRSPLPLCRLAGQPGVSADRKQGADVWIQSHLRGSGEDSTICLTSLSLVLPLLLLLLLLWLLFLMMMLLVTTSINVALPGLLNMRRAVGCDSTLVWVPALCLLLFIQC